MRHALKLFLPFLALLLPAGPTPAQTPLPQPDPLGIETIVNLGVAVGDISTPQRVALDEEAGQVYLLSQGGPQQGNAIAVFDIAEGNFTDRLPLNTGGDFEPLDLQFDPDSSLLYALWRDRYADTRPILTVIDSKTLQIVEEIAEVESFAAVNSMLYTANAEELAAVNLSNNSPAQARRGSLFLAGATGPLGVDPTANRLYLARSTGPDWTIEIFEADTFNPITTLLAEGKVLDILPLPTAGQLLFTTMQGNFRILNRITTEGDLADLPFELGPFSGAAGIALSPTGRTLFYSNGQYPPTGPDDPTPGPALVGLDSQTLLETHYIPLLNNIADVTVGADNAAYGVSPFNQHLYSINLTQQTVDVTSSLITVRGATVDPAGGNLFITDSANRVRRLNSKTLTVLDETRLQNNWADYGFQRWSWSGQLTLDPEQARLYVSGLPATVVDTESLAELKTLDPGGQITTAPGHDSIYVSNCGVTILPANTLSGGAVITGTTQRPDQLSPNPCVVAGHLDGPNQWLYSQVSNGVAGSNAGNFLMVYDVSAKPTAIYTDTTISVAAITPDSAGQRAFVSSIRHSNRRLRSLDITKGSYANHLLGLWGTSLYSEASNRLYINDGDLHRLLTVNADTLTVIDALSLPPGDDYRLLALDPATDRLFLAGAGGGLLIAAPGAATDAAAVANTAPQLAAGGAVLTLAQPAGSPAFGRVNAATDDFSTEPRLYANDKGESWLNLSANLPPYPLQTVAASPNFAQDGTLFAGVLLPGQSGGLYRSVDGGATWQPAMIGLHDVWVDRLFIDPQLC